MLTTRLYYDDCYTSLFRAELVELSFEGNRAYLDKTFFYPTSGGQPHDLGSIAGVPVVDVVDEGDRIAHVLGGVAADGEVSCLVDWDRRYDHMQQHTGQHLLSAALVELFGYKTLSFHMGEDVSSIEIGTSKLEDLQIEAVERRVNTLVSEARPVRISYEDAAGVAGLRKASDRTGLLRIITVDSYDRSACGGTHVRSTAEIGCLQIREMDRVRGNIRLEFVCGARALRHSKQDFRLLSKLAKAASVQPRHLEEHVTSLRTRLELAAKALTLSNAKLAEEEASKLYEQTTPLLDGAKRHLSVIAESTDSARALAVAFASHTRAVMVVVPESLPGTVLLACSADSGLHAGALWKATFAAGGGRGGGSATLAQGIVTDRDALGRLLTAAGINQQ